MKKSEIERGIEELKNLVSKLREINTTNPPTRKNEQIIKRCQVLDKDLRLKITFLPDDDDDKCELYNVLFEQSGYATRLIKAIEQAAKRYQKDHPGFEMDNTDDDELNPVKLMESRRLPDPRTTLRNLQLQIAKDFEYMREIQEQFNLILKQDGEKLPLIEENLVVANENHKDGNRDLIKAIKYKTSAHYKKAFLIAAGVGAVCAGPAGILAGLTGTAIAAVAVGGAVGTGAATAGICKAVDKIKTRKADEVGLTMDEHLEWEEDLDNTFRESPTRYMDRDEPLQFEAFTEVDNALMVIKQSMFAGSDELVAQRAKIKRCLRAVHGFRNQLKNSDELIKMLGGNAVKVKSRTPETSTKSAIHRSIVLPTQNQTKSEREEMYNQASKEMDILVEAISDPDIPYEERKALSVPVLGALRDIRQMERATKDLVDLANMINKELSEQFNMLDELQTLTNEAGEVQQNQKAKLNHLLQKS